MQKLPETEEDLYQWYRSIFPQEEATDKQLREIAKAIFLVTANGCPTSQGLAWLEEETARIFNKDNSEASVTQKEE